MMIISQAVASIVIHYTIYAGRGPGQMMMYAIFVCKQQIRIRLASLI